MNLSIHVKRHGKYNQDVTDGADKGITAVKTYLKSIAQVKFPDQSKEWIEIMRMAEMRNCYLHRRGRLKKDSDALREYIGKKKGMIELTGIDEIKLNAGYCEHAIAVIETFFTCLMKEIPDELLGQSVEDDFT